MIFDEKLQFCLRFYPDDAIFFFDNLTVRHKYSKSSFKAISHPLRNMLSIMKNSNDYFSVWQKYMYMSVYTSDARRQVTSLIYMV